MANRVITSGNNDPSREEHAGGFSALLNDDQNIRLFLFLCVAVGALLRFYNLNWDHGKMFHPDERNIANAVTKIVFGEQMNPQFFAYGGFSIYLYRAVGGLLAYVTHEPDWVISWGKINLIGRYLAAFFSTLTIIPLYCVAQRIAGRWVAVIATLLFTFCVTSIQIAHYSITESMITLIVVTLCLISLRMMDRPTVGHYFVFALLFGVAVAAKTSSISFLVFPLAAHCIALQRAHHSEDSKQFWDLLWYFPAALLVSFLVFFFFSPYTLLDFKAFMGSMSYEGGVVNGSTPVPYTRQFVKTLPYLYWLQNWFWQFGPVALLAIIGIPWLIVTAVRTRDPRLLLLLSFPILYFLYVGKWHTKFIRYMLPITPFLLIAAAYVLWEIRQCGRKISKPVIGRIAVVLSVGVTVLWSTAFMHVYWQQQTRIAASAWMFENIPAGSNLLGEHWDDGLPVDVADVSPVPFRQFNVKQLRVYDEDNTEGKITYLADKLSKADYLIFNSRRLYGTLRHLPEQYPIASQYYRLLFDGKLGFEKEAEFASYPSLFGLVINDDASEETFQVYEHPKVMVYKNTGHLKKEEIAARLRRALAELGTTLSEAPFADENDVYPPGSAKQ